MAGAEEPRRNPMVSVNQRFWPMFALLLTLLAFQQFTSIRLESQTFDEGTHLVAGYRYLTTGDYRMNPEHPPLAKLWCALPLLLLRPSLPAKTPNFSPMEQFENGG